MLKPGNGKTHRAYLWSYCTTQLQPDQGGRLRLRRQPRRPACARVPRAARRADGWRGKLVCDDFSGYKACFELGVTEAGCLAHARRKFHELWANHSSHARRASAEVLRQALRRRARGARRSMPTSANASGSDRPNRWPMRCTQWLLLQRQKVPDGSATAKAIDYSLKPLGGADALHRRRRPAHRQQLGREPDPADRDGLFIVPHLVKCLKTLRSGSRHRCDTGDLFARRRR